MSSQTETKTGAGFKAGVKDYRLTYYTPDYQVTETDILAAFRMTPQPGVPAEECGAAVAAESSTGTWTTVWTDGLTQLDRVWMLSLLVKFLFYNLIQLGLFLNNFLNSEAMYIEKFFPFFSKVKYFLLN